MQRDRCQGLGWLVVLAFFIGCIGTGFADDADPIVTSITIDGEAGDWDGRAVAAHDSQTDAEESCYDLGTGYAFVNRDALYFLIELTDPEATCEQFDIEIRADSRTLLLSWRPGSKSAYVGDITSGYEGIGDTQFSMLAIKSALEGRIDLRDLGPPETVWLRRVAVMTGPCCDWPAWHAADEWRSSRRTLIVDEIDPGDATAGGAAITAENPFGLPEGWTWEYAFVPPAASITGIVTSKDGTVFIQQSGRSPAISVLDPTTGEIDTVIELPAEASTYRTLVKGPANSVFVPVMGAVWRVFSDGLHETWGNASQGWPFAYTSDDYLIGRSHQGDLIRMFPDGSAKLISDQFEGIDSVVQIAGALFVSDVETGSIVRIDPDGTHHVLAKGILRRDPMDLAADAQGNLYLNCVATHLVRVDKNTGAFSSIHGSDKLCSIHPADFDFVSNSRVLFADPTESQIVWLDLAIGNHGVLVSSQGSNSWALDIGPDGRAYIGVSGCSGPSAYVARLEENGEQTVVVDGLRGEIRDIGFDTQGGLFVATHQQDTGEGPTYYVAPNSGVADRVWGVDHLHTVTVNPLTMRAIGADFCGERIIEFTPWALWREHSIKLPKRAFDFKLDAGPDGTLYATCAEEERQFTGPIVERWILRIDLKEDQAYVVAQNDREGCCTMTDIYASPDGSLWWVISPEFELYRMDAQGNIELFARNLPIDPAAVAVNRDGVVYLTSSTGILRFYPKK